MWVLDLLDEVESDFSVFHKIERPLELDSPRFFRLVNQLAHYNGAVRGQLIAQRTSAGPTDEDIERMATPPGAITFDDVSTIVAMAEDNTGQFPTIGHAGG